VLTISHQIAMVPLAAGWASAGKYAVRARAASLRRRVAASLPARRDGSSAVF
jgi:hypothetical protein